MSRKPVEGRVDKNEIGISGNTVIDAVQSFETNENDAFSETYNRDIKK